MLEDGPHEPLALDPLDGKEEDVQAPQPRGGRMVQGFLYEEGFLRGEGVRVVDQEADVLQVLDEQPVAEMEGSLEVEVADGLGQRLCRGDAGGGGGSMRRMCWEEGLDHTQPDQHTVCSTSCSSSVGSLVVCGCSSPWVVFLFRKAF